MHTNLASPAAMPCDRGAAHCKPLQPSFAKMPVSKPCLILFELMCQGGWLENDLVWRGGGDGVGANLAGPTKTSSDS